MMRDMAGRQLLACHECGLLQREAPLAAGDAAHSRALARLSRDIAGAIRSP
jgi:hypothetical protein